MKIEKKLFGKMPDGTAVEQFTLANANGVVCKLLDYGVRIASLEVPDAKGNLSDVILGFNELDGYLRNAYISAVCGRVANRIAGAKFFLDGKALKVTANEGENQLHGGKDGFDKKIWRAETRQNGVEFSYRSPDGEEGFPGNLDVKVFVALTDANEVRLDFTATTDKPTPVNLTSHGYFNLAGRGNVLGHELMLAAEFYTPVDSYLIPTGEIKSVKGTGLDFSTPKTIGSQMKKFPEVASGYDHNFVVKGGGKNLVLAARVREPKSGRIMEAWTTEPGVQLYTASHFDGFAGRGGARYEKFGGFCLETQHFPDSVNHPRFPSVILRPGETFRQTCIYKFPS
ncbi:MAG TPA: aldose epimerase family protein [Verrucomicrobiae bacterium]|nr:aldose epimerase family protein [Verrucomicrobiae bacterium]